MKTWEDIRAASTGEIIAWAATQPWAAEMKACMQDNEWHAEGDVWTHTCMVVDELQNLKEWPDLNRSEQLKLTFTALFHDSGKPATTVTDPVTGKVQSPKHSAVGEGICRNVLRDMGCDLLTREAICGLVRYHGRPAFLQHRSKPEMELIELSWLVSHKLLHLFALADFRGRKTEASNRTETDIDLWKMVAEEAGCLDSPYAFANDHARFLFYRKQLSSLHYVPVEKHRCTVTIMAGLPGSGKDTWLAENRPELHIVSLDDLRRDYEIDPSDNQGKVIQAGRERCREHLRAGRDFAFNATNILKLTRTRWVDLCADYGARIEIVYVEPPLATIVRQNAGRKAPVPTAVIRKLTGNLDPPDWTECHHLTLFDGNFAKPDES